MGLFIAGDQARRARQQFEDDLKKRKRIPRGEVKIDEHTERCVDANRMGQHYDCICEISATPLTDIMRRMMLGDSFTIEEARLYDRMMNMCVDTPTIDSLYVLINALKMRALARGLKVNLSLSRPARSPKAKSGETLAVFETLEFSETPGERKMGQIERELRTHQYDITKASMATGAHTVYSGARISLKMQYAVDPDPIDIMSEAIEAAEALGL
jgi:hypothetical protein